MCWVIKHTADCSEIWRVAGFLVAINGCPIFFGSVFSVIFGPKRSAGGVREQLPQVEMNVKKRWEEVVCAWMSPAGP